jgi:AhpC/TSA family
MSPSDPVDARADHPGYDPGDGVDAGDGGTAGGAARRPPRYGRYAGLLALLILALITLNTIRTKPNGFTGIAPGQPLAPFAVPLVLGNLEGDANIATHADQGAAGRVPACTVRGPQVLNICEMYEKGPVVLALFVDGGSCPAVLTDMQTLAPSFPGVRFAAVSIKGERDQLRRLVSSKGLTMPVGIDSDGALAALYKVASCPQVSLAYPGGVVQSRALLHLPTLAVLRARVAALVAASRARGWRQPAR